LSFAATPATADAACSRAFWSMIALIAFANSSKCLFVICESPADIAAQPLRLTICHVSSQPTNQPSRIATNQPTNQPSLVKNNQPTNQPNQLSSSKPIWFAWLTIGYHAQVGVMSPT